MDFLSCILKIYPDWKGSVIGDSYDGIKPHSSETRPIPSLNELESIWPEVRMNILLQNIRTTRNTLLANCDWTQLPDVTLTPEKVTEWRVYRQALRDFPSTCDPDNPIWPVPPL